MIDVHKYAKENDLIKFSAVPHLDTIREFLKNLKIKNVVDIGTWKGISAAYLAQFANKVYTFDRQDRIEKYKIWDDLGVSNKIEFYLVKGRRYPDKEKAVDNKPIIDSIEFNFAFVDGEHTEKDVRADFELVKKCGRVLFHDIIPFYPGIVKLTQEIGIKKLHRFLGYWEAK